MTKPTKWVCTQWRLRSAWASTKSDQSLRCPHEETLVLSYPSSAQRRLWSDWADVQADLSLHWAHSHFVGFVMSQLIYHLDTSAKTESKGTSLLYSLLCTVKYPNLISAMTWQNQQSDCEPSEDLNQPGHPQRCPGWSESSLGAQSLCWFCHVAAHLLAKNLNICHFL